MSDNIGEGQEWNGPLGALSPSPWLSALDIPHEGETIVQIEKAVKFDSVEFVQAGGRKEAKRDYGALKFVGRTKLLGLNATLKRTLALLFGSSAKSLKGQHVALFVDTKVKVGGEVKCAVRIVARKVDPPRTAAPNTAAPAAKPAEPLIQPEPGSNG